jgi:hypothetical protein
MSPEGQRIIEHLNVVAAERTRRARDRALGARVQAVKAYQHSRFERTYADALASPRYRQAARFFLDDLYGPHDFTQRDQQFARIVPGLVRLFPREIVLTVETLGDLHALSERFDSAMGERLASTEIDAAQYGAAWRSVGQPAERERQIGLMLQVGRALERYTRNPVLRHSLRMMRGPATLAGLGALQGFLERGFDTFREMGGAHEFLDMIATRERALAASLFAGEDVAAATGAGPGAAARATADTPAAAAPPGAGSPPDAPSA